MIVSFRLFCLVIISLCHEGLAKEALADTRIFSRILKRTGLDWNDPIGADVMFAGNDLLMRNEQRNGHLFRISKRKEQDRIIRDIERQFYHFLLRYYTGCEELLFYSSKFLQGNQQAQSKD
jgi:hypothetical protein